MKVKHPCSNQEPNHGRGGLQVAISDKAFVALLKTIVLLVLIIAQGQDVVSTLETRLSYPLQLQQDHLP